jgi:CHAD domain-containing protein
MSFAFHGGESVGRGVRRIALAQIDGALEQLRGRAGTSREEAVHDSRKRFKKVRALVRLARAGLGLKVYRRENASFRDAGRPLSEARDAQVLVQTVEKLIGLAAGGEPDRPFPAVLAAVQAHRDAVYRRVFGEEDAGARVIAALEQARTRVEGWAVRPDGWPALGPGLERLARRGLRAFTEAAAEPTVERLHAWRKRVKDLWHQLQLLTPLWPGTLEMLADRAHDLADLLGDDHDLAVLAQLLRDETGERWGDPAAREGLLALIDHRRAQLQRSALDLGARVHADEPGVLAARLGACWEAWQSEGKKAGRPAGV